MPTNLTGSTIASTFGQLLHVDGGPTATEKAVYSGTGVATALKVGTISASVGNVQLTGNTIQATSGDLILGSNIAFDSVSNARTALGLGTMATQNSNNVAITGGSITNATFTNIDVLSGKVPFNTITNRAYGQFYSTQDQTTTANTPVAVTFNNSDAMNAGVTVASNSRITFAAAGDYDVYFNVQLANAENVDHEVTFWLKLNGTDVANSATRIVVPASGVGGTGFFAFNSFLRVTAGQYVEVYWAPEDADVSLSYEAAVPSTPFARPAIPSAVLTATRIG